jgi:hypothetical protein
VVLATPALAKTTFLPNASIGRGYTSNIAYTDVGPEESDGATLLRVDLPLVIEQPTKVWTLAYRPSYVKYDTFDELDYAEHLVNIGVESTVDRRTTFAYRASYQKTQSQDVPLGGPETDESFLYYRTDRESIATSLTLGRELSQSWRGIGTFGVQWIETDEISDSDIGVPEAALGDRTSYGVDLGALRRMSRRTELGFGYGYTDYEIDPGEDSSIQDLRARMTHQHSRVTSFECSLGGSYRSEAENYDLVAGFHVVRAFERGSFRVSAARAAANGDVIAGSYLRTSAEVRYDSELTQKWGWSARSRYAVRDPDDPVESRLRNLRHHLGLRFQGGGLGRRGTFGVGFRLGIDAVNQWGGDAVGLDSSYVIYNAGIVGHWGRGEPR